ncbi:sensor histidine kinase [Spirosoma pollinicola]|uniref:sensor histidine kinase n=1 Tax=Spirosoma pollinicola TaxID=2057025 RepID=UPI001475AD57
MQDTGDGIAPDQLAYLQQVFSGKRRPQVGTHGLGLGLVLINDFARRNGATLRFNSQPGQGTTVSVLCRK